MSTPTPRTDTTEECDMPMLASQLETELTTALARVAELETTLSKIRNGLLFREAKAEQVKINSLTRQLSESQAQLSSLREANAVLQSQVDNADINLEQVRMAQKGLWRTKVESAESRIKELEAQLAKRAENVSREEANELQDVLRTLTPSGLAFITSARELVQRWEEQKTEIQTLSAQLASAREDSARLDWLDASKSFEAYPLDGYSQLLLTDFTGQLNVRHAIDSARGHLAETPVGGETGKDAWQDIATAPKDGTLILVSDGVYVHEAKWSGAQWCVADSWKNWWLKVKFWCALPPPPQGKETK